MATSFVVVRRRRAVAANAGFRVGIKYGHKAAGLGKWQRTEQHRVDHGKNRQIGAETNGECQKSRSCESGRLSQQSGSVTQLPLKFIKQVNSERLAAIPFDIGKAPKLYPREAGRFPR